MAIEQIKIELHNAQFMGDLVTGTTAPRDMAACRRCVECGFEAIMQGKAKELCIRCPNCEARYSMAIHTWRILQATRT
jgi:hypothetical protein